MAKTHEAKRKEAKGREAKRGEGKGKEKKIASRILDLWVFGFGFWVRVSGFRF